MASMGAEEPPINFTLPRSGHLAHPILGNFHLPVEVEDGHKASGVHNLAREGWSEEKCRNYLVRLCADVPRNLPYKDGLRILHPRLQERFGDENVDLALGVLEELIEVEELPPFPPCIFQRWKYEHLRRREDFTNPHVPHTTTIQAPVVPTKTLLDYREQQAQKHFLYPQPSPSTMPSYESLNSKIAHQPSWRIEHSVFVSIGGKQASVAYCPTPAELHKGMWDPEYGRLGARVQTCGAHMSSPSSTNGPAESSATIPNYLTPTRAQLKNATRDMGKRMKSQIQEFGKFPNSLAHSGVEASSIQLHDSVSVSTGGSHKYNKEGYLKNRFGTRNVELPVGVEVPNANFARKHQLIPNGYPIPNHLLLCRSPTRDEIVARLCEIRIREAVNCSKHNPLRFFMTKGCSIPATPSLFFDGGLDYKWDDAESVLSSTSDNPEPQSYCEDRQRLQTTRLPLGGSLSQEHATSQSLHCSPQSFGRMSSTVRRHHHTEAETLLPTIYDPLQNSSSNHEVLPSLPVVPKENIENSWESNQQTIEPTDDNLSVMNQSWEAQYMNAFRNSSGRCVKWSEPEPTPDLDLAIGLLSSATYSPQSSPDQLVKAVRSVHDINWSSETAEDFLPHFSVGHFGTINHSHGTIGHHSRTLDNTFDDEIGHVKFPYAELHQSNGSHTLVNPTPPRRLHERSFLPYGWREDNHPVTVNQQTEKSPKDCGKSGGDFSKQETLSFDGANDNHSPENNLKDDIRKKQTASANTTNRDHNSFDSNDSNHSPQNTRGAKKFLMELSQGHLPTISPPQPLYIRKQSSQIRFRTGAERQNNNISYPETRYPPRTSSIPKYETSQVEEKCDIPSREVRSNSPISHSTISSSRGTTFSRAISECPTTDTVTQSNVSETKGYYYSGSSRGLLGDFIPIGTPDSCYSPQPQLPGKMNEKFNSETRKAAPLIDLYRFEPETPAGMNESHQTSFADFIESHDSRPASSPNLSHTKNSRSVEKELHRSPMLFTSSQVVYPGLKRSGSSPNVSPTRFAVRDQHLSPEPFECYGDPDSPSPIMQHSYNTKSTVPRGRAATIASRYPTRRESPERFQHASSSPIRQVTRNMHQRPSHSPVRQAERIHGCHTVNETHSPTGAKVVSNKYNELFSSSDTTIINRNMTRSQSKTLLGVVEQDESAIDSPVLPSASPKKRSRSPMKKMFGEHGWLGSSPNEITRLQTQATKSIRKSEKPRKAGMMEKIKSKIEELTEKTDSKNIDKNKVSVLSISISPFEQARYLVELELMIVHTANTFLMTQFSQGRMSIDTIKRTVDTWKNKGRPAVVEFMYDQATQRDLVAVNQFNFRFHGERLGEDVRITSMLYNWKQVASLMAIRTFCNADTVLLKLLFDIEQILELIGATESIMLRLQQLRFSINESIRIARLKTTNLEGTDGREIPCDSHHSTSTSRSISVDDPYGGMKLVPDFYVE